MSAAQRIGLIAMALAILYLLVAASSPPLAFWSSDSEIKFLQLQNLRWEDGPKIDLRFAGRALDPNFAAVPLGHAFYEVRGGHVFLVWSIAFSLLSLPFYKLFGALGLFVIPAASGAGTAYVAGRIAERLRPRTGIWATALVGMTTPILLYSSAFWEHTLAVFCTTWGIYKIASSERTSSRVLGGLAIGFAAGTLRADLYPLVGAFLVVTFLVDRRRATALACGLALASAPSWGVNMLLHGHLLPLNAAKNFSHFTLEYLTTAKLRAITDFVVGRGAEPMVAIAFCILAPLVALLLRFGMRSRVVRTWVVPALFVILSVLALAITRTLIESHAAPAPYHGFLAICPFLVVAATFRSDASADPQMGRTLARTAVLYLALYAASIFVATPLGPGGGFLEWGPRYFLPIYPLGIALAVAAVPAWLEDTRGAGRLITIASLAALALVGLQQEMTGVGVLGTHARNRHALRQMLSASTEPVISDVWWALMTPTGAAAEKPMFFAWYFEQMRDLVSAVRAHGTGELTVISHFAYEEHPLLQRMAAEGMPITLVSSDKTALELYVMRIHVEAP